MILVDGRCEVNVNIPLKPSKSNKILVNNFSPQKSNILTHKVAVLESFNFIGDECLLSTEDFKELDIGLSDGTYIFNVRSLSN